MAEESSSFFLTAPSSAVPLAGCYGGGLISDLCSSGFWFRICLNRERQVYSVIFVCTGNMCRSPMAEGILKSKLKEIGRDDIAVSSMGIHAPAGEKASPDGIAVCAENSIDISTHQTRPLLFDELKSADLVFTMEGFQSDFIRTFFPQIADKLFLFAAWPSEGKEKKAQFIPDPIGGNRNDYRRTFQLITSHVDRIMPFLLAEFALTGC
jgi:glycine hydroxymethyltransferase